MTIIRILLCRWPAHEGVISSDAGRISLRVVRADDELMIARAVCRTIDLKIGRG